MLKSIYPYSFSICTLVTQWSEYEIMKSSFENNGFDDNCEYMQIDNAKGNVADAYEAIRYFLNNAKGEFVIIVHQDVRCIDSKNKMMHCINELHSLDKNWAICGNAGAKGYHQDIMYINTNGRIDITKNLPCKVHSLDENLLIIDAKKRITLSGDIKGFHFYGTDLCIVANFLGYSSYVIPFMVKHLSHGNLKDMELHRKPFINLYGNKLKSRYIQTSCTKFFLSNSVLKNKLYNIPFLFFFVKTWQRLKYNFVLLTKGNVYPKKTTHEN